MWDCSLTQLDLTGLHFAAAIGHLPILKSFLSHGAEINSADVVRALLPLSAPPDAAPLRRIQRASGSGVHASRNPGGRNQRGHDWQRNRPPQGRAIQPQ